MFLDRFGLREQPFGVTPDPHFLYFSPSHVEALASLFYGIQTHRGFMALIAKPGMGKTTLLFHLLERLRSSARTAFLFQAHNDSRDFLRSLVVDLGINEEGGDLVNMHRRLNEMLISEVRAGRRVVVVIDEAQNLADSVLEAVRMLSNFEIAGRKLMNIVLAGQPQLADKLASRNMIQLRQRISILTRLRQFSASETGNYVNHRLRVAGYRGKPLFTAEALSIIHSRCGGIPRNINNLCFNALTLAFANGRNVVDARIVNEVLEDLDLEILRSDESDIVAVGPQSKPGDLTDPTPLMDGRAYGDSRWLGQDIISGNLKLLCKIGAENDIHDHSIPFPTFVRSECA